MKINISEYLWLAGVQPLEEAKAMPIGTKSTHGGQEVVKTKDGWVPVSKAGGAAAGGKKPAKVATPSQGQVHKALKKIAEKDPELKKLTDAIDAGKPIKKKDALEGMKRAVKIGATLGAGLGAATGAGMGGVLGGGAKGAAGAVVGGAAGTVGGGLVGAAAGAVAGWQLWVAYRQLMKTSHWLASNEPLNHTYMTYGKAPPPMAGAADAARSRAGLSEAKETLPDSFEFKGSGDDFLQIAANVVSGTGKHLLKQASPDELLAAKKDPKRKAAMKKKMEQAFNLGTKGEVKESFEGSEDLTEERVDPATLRQMKKLAEKDPGLKAFLQKIDQGKPVTKAETTKWFKRWMALGAAGGGLGGGILGAGIGGAAGLAAGGALGGVLGILLGASLYLSWRNIKKQIQYLLSDKPMHGVYASGGIGSYGAGVAAGAGAAALGEAKGDKGYYIKGGSDGMAKAVAAVLLSSGKKIKKAIPAEELKAAHQNKAKAREVAAKIKRLK